MPNWRLAQLAQVERALEEARERALQAERLAVKGSRSKTAADERYRRYTSYLLSLRRMLAFLEEDNPPVSLPSTLIVLPPPEPSPLPLPVREPEFQADPCPWCGKAVSVAENPVWTCPADVRRNAPGWRPPLHKEIVQLRRQRSVPLSCGRAYGLSCYRDVPAHEACHQRG